jgi:formate--tetrahydrofolate ligase
MKTDIEIQRDTMLLPIEEIAKNAGFARDQIELYGNTKCKIKYDQVRDAKPKKGSRLVLVTAISPTPAGVGKTTNVIGIVDALCKLGHNTIAALREPSLGPTLGMKGGAAGGGYAQVAPLEDINLHFTGDFHAVTYANNLLSCLIDNHVNFGNKSNLDYRDIKFKRTIDLDDRSLRELMIGLGDKNGYPRHEGFNITAASEVMAILTLSKDLADLKERCGRILVGYTFEGNPIFARTMEAHESMAVLMKDAIKPNLVQTLENNPAIIHSGPFGNIATGTSSIISIRVAMSKGDLVVTEAGFGADLGAEKFFDILCREGDFAPSAVVIMASIQALKYHGGVLVPQLKAENINAIEKGFHNLKVHVENLKLYGIPVIVGLNRFPSDTDKEIEYTLKLIKKMDVKGFLTEPFTKGGEGCISIAEEIVKTVRSMPYKPVNYLYPLDVPIKEKINTIATKIYRAVGVEYSRKALRDIQKIESIGFGSLPVCIAKTQYSISDDPKILSLDAPYSINIDEVRLSAGAGFIIPIAGNMMTMPGLPMKPNTNNMKIDNDGIITGLE